MQFIKLDSYQNGEFDVTNKIVNLYLIEAISNV